eukprot:3431162-Pyramimonas_sp.AAC.1
MLWSRLVSLCWSAHRPDPRTVTGRRCRWIKSATSGGGRGRGRRAEKGRGATMAEEGREG